MVLYGVSVGLVPNGSRVRFQPPTILNLIKWIEKMNGQKIVQYLIPHSQVLHIFHIL